MAIRMKTRFRAKGPKTVADRANVIGYNLWKIAQETVRHMEKEGFKFASDAQLVAVMTEVIAFLVQIADRLVYGQVNEEDRAVFVNALGRDLAGHAETNLAAILGPGESASAPGQVPRRASEASRASESARGPHLAPIGDHARRFIDTLNARFADYAEYDFSREGGPSYAFVRYLGDRISAEMAQTDNKWVVEHVMEIEAPEAIKLLRKLVHEVMGIKVG